MNLGTFLLLLIAWAASGTIGILLLRKKGYQQDVATQGDAWGEGAGMHYWNGVGAL